MNRTPVLTRTLFGALALFATASTSMGAAHANWPQWRGPLANGVAPEATPPVSWSESTNVKWKVKIPGLGASTPIVWEDQVFILSAIPTGRTPGAANATSPPPAPRTEGPGARSEPEQPTEVQQFAVLAFDRQTGRERWRRIAREELPHEGHHRDHGFASSSPVTDGESLFVNYGSRGLYAYDLKGHLKWEKDLGDMRTRNGFGEGSSPALHGNTLVVNWDHEEADFIAAFDKLSGRELWRQSRDEPTAWTTPLIVEHDGRAEVIVSGTRRVRSYDLATGQQRWECGGMTLNVIPTPVSDFGLVYLMSGFRGKAVLAIRLGHTGDLTDSKAIAWRHDRHTPYVPSPLLYGERLYFYSDNTATLSILAAQDGRPLLDAIRLPGILRIYASPIGADGRVYLADRDGKTLVIRHGDTLEVLATNSLEDQFDASPAAAGKQLFLRGHEHLYCLEE